MQIICALKIQIAPTKQHVHTTWSRYEMAKVFGCYFMRSNILRGFENHHNTKKQNRFLDFKVQFQHVSLTEKHFHRKSSDLRAFYRKKHDWKNKTDFFEMYSKESWEKLTLIDQSMHSLNHCIKCQGEQTSPNRNNTQTVSIINIPVPEKNQTKQPYILSAASTVLEDLNNSWETLYKTPFTKIIPKIPEACLTPRKSKNEKQKNLRKIHKKIKKNIEDSWTKENRDVSILYGTRQSGARYEKQRKGLFFENTSSALTGGALSKLIIFIIMQYIIKNNLKR